MRKYFFVGAALTFFLMLAIRGWGDERSTSGAYLKASVSEEKLGAPIRLVAASPEATPKRKISYSLAGTWRGTYYYVFSDGTPVDFVVTATSDGGWFSGRISEPNTFGDKSSDKLFADIKGAIFEDGRIVFIKKYDGTAGVSHFVEYEGYLDQRQGTIRGKWLIRPDWWGTFRMVKSKD